MNNYRKFLQNRIEIKVLWATAALLECRAGGLTCPALVDRGYRERWWCTVPCFLICRASAEAEETSVELILISFPATTTRWRHHTNTSTLTYKGWVNSPRTAVLAFFTCQFKGNLEGTVVPAFQDCNHPVYRHKGCTSMRHFPMADPPKH